jgi:hypothetical protein
MNDFSPGLSLIVSLSSDHIHAVLLTKLDLIGIVDASRLSSYAPHETFYPFLAAFDFERKRL